MKISYFLFFFFSIFFMAESLLAAQRPGPRTGYGARQLASAPLSDDDFASEGDDGFEDDMVNDRLSSRPGPSARRVSSSFGPSSRSKFQAPRMSTPKRRAPMPKDDYGDDGFEDDLADDQLPPRPSLSARRAPASFDPSARPKFQPPSRINTSPKKTVMPEDDYGDDGFEDDLADDQLPSRPGVSAPQAPGYLPPAGRGGFQQKSGMDAPQRIAPMSEDDYGDEGFEDRPLEDQKKSEYLPAELPPRNYPPKMTHLQFGQTEWNQMDLHSLVDGRKA